MPGGSVNGRPFRESIHSYKYTGVPCGNPSRYASSDVVRMDARHSGYMTSNGPVEEIETEGERQLKTLVKKQLDTNVTLKDQLSKRKEFSAGVSHKPDVEKLSGIMVLSKYKKVEELDSKTEDLRHCGLTEDEIQQKLYSTKDTSSITKKRRFEMDPSILVKNCTEIEKKIQQKQSELALPDKVSGVKTIGRHQMDLEKSVIKGSQRSEFLSNVLTNQKVTTQIETLHPDHPMNHLPDILHTLERSLSRRRHKRNKNKNAGTVFCGPLNKVISENEQSNVETQNTEADDRMRDVTVTSQESESEKESSFISDNTRQSLLLPADHKCIDSRQTCSPKESMVPSSETERIDPVPEDLIQKFRLTEEEIRKIPRFENYTPGKFNKVLYLKNLARQVSHKDLVALFSRFQKEGGPDIIYRLLTGRMKGQAFVTFDSCETAERALKLVNGYQLKGKPIIIQYGNK